MTDTNEPIVQIPEKPWLIVPTAGNYARVLRFKTFDELMQQDLSYHLDDAVHLGLEAVPSSGSVFTVFGPQYALRPVVIRTTEKEKEVKDFADLVKECVNDVFTSAKHRKLQGYVLLDWIPSKAECCPFVEFQPQVQFYLHKSQRGQQ